jgi:hypothetical protein
MIDTLEQIQARNRLLLEEMRQEAQRFIELLEAWAASDDEDLSRARGSGYYPTHPCSDAREGF